MLKMTIDNEEVVSNKNFTIKEEMLNASSTILNNAYPKTWEQDKDYITRFYFPRDYAKLNIQNHTIVQDYEAGTTVQVNGSATLTDVDTSKNSKVTKLLGQTSQTTYTGKNLFYFSSSYTSQTINGLTMTRQADGSVKVTGTAESQNTNSWFNGSYGAWNTPNKTQALFTLEANTKIVCKDVALFYLYEDNSKQNIQPNIEGYSSATLTQKAYIMAFRMPKVVTGTTYNTTIYPQMEIGLTPTSFEPYVGGVPSPNPNYPQDVHIVSGDNTIDICGKNLWNYNFNQSTNIRLNSDAFSVLPNTTYTISSTSDIMINSYYKDANKTDISNSGFQSLPFTFTTSENCYFIQQTARKTDNTAIVPSDVVNYQLEKSNQATTYEPYIGNSYPIYLGVENLFDGSNINLIDGYYVDGTGKIVAGTNNKFNWVKLQPNTTYTLNQDIVSNVTKRIALYSTQPVANATGTIVGTFTGTTAIVQTFTTTDTNIYLGWVYCNTNNLGGHTQQEMIDSIVVNKGNIASHTSIQPIELCKIGTYQDSIYKGKGYNLFDNIATSQTKNNITFTKNENGTILANGTANGTSKLDLGQVYLYANQTYYLSGCPSGGSSGKYMLSIYDSNNTRLADDTGSGVTYTPTTSGNYNIGVLYWYNFNLSNLLFTPMLTEGTTSLPYEPYNAKDKWLLHKEVGKGVLDGSESWQYVNNTFRTYLANIGVQVRNAKNQYSNYYQGIPYNANWGNYDYFVCNETGTNAKLVIKNKDITTVADFKTWLSTHNTIVYYVLATPTNTEITDETLLAQLDDLESS